MLYTSEIITFAWRSTLLCMVGVALFCGAMLIPAETARVAANKENVKVSANFSSGSVSSADSPTTQRISHRKGKIVISKVWE